MNFRLLEQNLPTRNLRVSLKKIYGLGHARVDYLCSLLGLGMTFHVLHLNKYLKDSFRFILLQYTYLLGQNLSLILTQRFELFIQLSLYKGIRFLRGLPWRGQRTASNSRSIKRFVVKFKRRIKHAI